MFLGIQSYDINTNKIAYFASQEAEMKQICDKSHLFTALG